MQKITTINELNAAIRMLEIRHEEETMLLQEQLKNTFENLRPANLIKNTFHELVSAPDFKKGVFDSILSNSAGYLSKKLMIGSTLNPLKVISGNLLQILVTSFISKNSGGIKSAAVQLINKIISKKNTVAN